MKQHIDLAPVDPLKVLYYQYKNEVANDEEIAKRDIRVPFFRFFANQGKSKRLINVAIRGEPGSGKSVVGLYLLMIVLDNFQKIYGRKIPIQNKIVQDQLEFLRVVKEPDNEKTCYLIDEFNPLANTGANATTEKAEYEYFTHLCRQYYIHRISCTPVQIYDSNVNVIIDIAGTDYKNKKTKITVLYRNNLENEVITLGSLWIDVSEVLKQEWYKKYELKKRARTDFLIQKGYRDLRELEFADVGIEIIKAVNEFIHEIDDLSTLNAYVKTKAQTLMQEKYKKPISFIAEDKILETPSAILRGLHTVNKLKEKQKKDGISRTKAIEALQLEVNKLFKTLYDKQQARVNYYKIMEE